MRSKANLIRTLAVGFIAILSATIALSSLASGGQCDKQAVEVIDVGIISDDLADSGITGSGVLCAKSGGLKAQLRIKNLAPGHAYTVWWVYFDDIDSCVPGFIPFIAGYTPENVYCGFADFGGTPPFPVADADNPQAVFGRFGSAVASPKGKAHFRDTLNGMLPSIGSEVWLLVFSHGPANYENGRALARQLLTPEDPTVGAPHLGVFEDAAAGIFGFPMAVTRHLID